MVAAPNCVNSSRGVFSVIYGSCLQGFLSEFRREIRVPIQFDCVWKGVNYSRQGINSKQKSLGGYYTVLIRAARSMGGDPMGIASPAACKLTCSAGAAAAKFIPCPVYICHLAYISDCLSSLHLPSWSVGPGHTCQPSRDCTDFDCYVPPFRFCPAFIDHPVLGGTSRFQV